jgi:predicted ATP-dependent endonuclease of OLD family
MIKLKEVIIDKYKVFTSPQTARIEDDVTALVGMNESGKTAFLEVLAKINFFDQNSSFHFNPLSDFPRHELKQYEGKIDELEVAVCKFEIKEKLSELIANDIGEETLPENFFYFGAKYNNWQVWKDFPVDVQAFLKFNLRKADIDDSVNSFIESINEFSEIPEKVTIVENPVLRKSIIDLFNYISGSAYPWPDPLKGYIAKKWFRPYLPLFWYFDEYYSLPSRINLNKLVESDDSDESFRTSKALFKLAKIDVNELLHTDNFEKFISELENTANLITEKIYSYWSTNKNLELEFEIEIEHHRKQVGKFFKNSEDYEERYLNIRIRDKYNRVSLPLNRRSKGFNWFFSFIVWFSQIEKQENIDYVLLLDEPGLNLHAVAQADLLKFIKDLAVDYQVIYTTHSPFMLSNEDLQKIRTIADFQDGSVISEVKNETDPETLFPIQVAIGYDIAQNLLVKRRNLVVESVPDFIILNLFNDYFKSQNELTLSDTIAITPLGGFSNVVKFITLMSGYSLDLVVLSPKNRLNISNNSIGSVNSLGVDKLLSYTEFIGDDVSDEASIFDLFAPEDFLKIVTEVVPSLKGILLVEDIIHPYIKSFNSTSPSPVTEMGLASHISRRGIGRRRHLPETFENFHALFEKVNSLFGVEE